MFYNLYNEGENPNILNIMEDAKMKRRIVVIFLIVLMFVMSIGMAGFTSQSQRAVDNSEVVLELVLEGFTNENGNKWTYHENINTGSECYIIIADYDMIKNHGDMIVSGCFDYYDGNGVQFHNLVFEFEWDYDLHEFVATNETGY